MIESLHAYYLDALGIIRYSQKPLLSPNNANTPINKALPHGVTHTTSLKSCSDMNSADERATGYLHDMTQADRAQDEKQGENIVSSLSSHNEPWLKKERKSRFAFWQPIEGLLVFSDVITDDSGNRQRELLKNIIYVVTSRIMHLSEPAIIEWPERLGNDLENLEICDFFSDCMDNLIELSEITRVLIFGSEPKFLLLMDRYIAVMNDGRCYLDCGINIAVLPSLKKMLHDWEAKRQAWEVLQAKLNLGEGPCTVV